MVCNNGLWRKAPIFHQRQNLATKICQWLRALQWKIDWCRDTDRCSKFCPVQVIVDFQEKTYLRVELFGMNKRSAGKAYSWAAIGTFANTVWFKLTATPPCNSFGRRLIVVCIWNKKLNRSFSKHTADNYLWSHLNICKVVWEFVSDPIFYLALKQSRYSAKLWSPTTVEAFSKILHEEKYTEVRSRKYIRTCLKLRKRRLLQCDSRFPLHFYL